MEKFNIKSMEIKGLPSLEDYLASQELIGLPAGKRWFYLGEPWNASRTGADSADVISSEGIDEICLPTYGGEIRPCITVLTDRRLSAKVQIGEYILAVLDSEKADNGEWTSTVLPYETGVRLPEGGFAAKDFRKAVDDSYFWHTLPAEKQGRLIPPGQDSIMLREKTGHCIYAGGDYTMASARMLAQDEDGENIPAIVASCADAEMLSKSDASYLLSVFEYEAVRQNPYHNTAEKGTVETWDAFASRCFRVRDIKKKTLWGKAGLTATQFKAMCNVKLAGISELQDICGLDVPEDIITTVGKLYGVLNAAGCRKMLTCIETAMAAGGLKLAGSIRAILDVSYSARESEVLLETFRDALSMYRQYRTVLGNYMPEISCADDIQKFHDRMTEIINEIRLMEEKEKMEEYQLMFDARRECVWKKWEFHEGCFEVVSPLSPQDIVKEGIELGHCVKSYMEIIALGLTNIMFIRRRKETDRPYFTVEVENDGTIRQIHGKKNCNVPAGSPLEKFIADWISECALKTDSYDRVLAPQAV